MKNNTKQPPARPTRQLPAAIMLLGTLAASAPVLAQGQVQDQGQFFPIPGISSEPGTNPAFCGISGTTGYSSVRVSGDGQVAATVAFRPGFVDGYVERRVIRWTEATGSVPITPYLEGWYPVTGLSFDGQIIYGDWWRWIASDGGYEDLSFQFLLNPGRPIYIFGCSDDAQTVTGVEGAYLGNEPLRLFSWSIDQAPRVLLPIVPEYPQGYFLFNSISGNGRVVAGAAEVPGFTNQRAGAIISESGAFAVTELGESHNVADLSFDGSAAVGIFTVGTRSRTFRWTAETGAVELDPEFAVTGENLPRAVSADGFSTVVGQYRVGVSSPLLAAIWQDGVGSDLKEYLISNFGLEQELSGWTLLAATDVSADGRTIVGQASNPEGCEQAFLVRLPPLPPAPGCSPADVAGAGATGLAPDGIVDGTDFIAFINSFSIGDAAVDSLADISGAGPNGNQPDGTIDGTDFISFINSFSLGC